MNDWLEQLSQTLTQATQKATQQATQLSQAIETEAERLIQQAVDWTDDLIDRTSLVVEHQVEEQLDQFEQILLPLWPDRPSLEEIDRQLDDWSDSFVNQIFQAEAQIQSWFQPLSQTVDPLLNDHPTCAGCRNYHGQSYGGEMLVCGLHPYGCQTEKCPDWEGIWPTKP